MKYVISVFYPQILRKGFACYNPLRVMSYPTHPLMIKYIDFSVYIIWRFWPNNHLFFTYPISLGYNKTYFLSCLRLIKMDEKPQILDLKKVFKGILK